MKSPEFLCAEGSLNTICGVSKMVGDLGSDVTGEMADPCPRCNVMESAVQGQVGMCYLAPSCVPLSSSRSHIQRLQQLRTAGWSL
jgi:hypothetical protein